MKRFMAVLISIVFVGSAGQVWAETKQPRKVLAQQNRMKVCAARYHEKKIPKSEYKSFMTQCLKKKRVVQKPIETDGVKK